MTTDPKDYHQASRNNACLNESSTATSQNSLCHNVNSLQSFKKKTGTNQSAKNSQNLTRDSSMAHYSPFNCQANNFRLITIWQPSTSSMSTLAGFWVMRQPRMLGAGMLITGSFCLLTQAIFFPTGFWWNQMHFAPTDQVGLTHTFECLT